MCISDELKKLTGRPQTELKAALGGIGWPPLSVRPTFQYCVFGICTERIAQLPARTADRRHQDRSRVREQGQGYLFSAPITREAVDEVLTANPVW